MAVIAEKISGLTIELDLDTLKVNSGLSDLKSKMKLVNSEMKANMSAFDRADRSVGKYETRLAGLNKKLEVQKAVTEDARKHYEKMVKEHGEGSVEAEKAAREYNNQAAALNNLDRYVQGVTDDLQKLQREQKIANSGWTKLGDKLEKAGGSLKNAGEKMGAVGSTLTNKITKPAVGAATALATLAIYKGFKRLIGIDTARAQLKALGHDAKTIEQIMDAALKSVEGTSYGLDEAATTAASAVAAGVKPTKELEKYLSLAADTAAVAGVEFNEMGDIFNKVQTSGRAQNDVLKQLSQRGIPIYQYLAKEVGKSAGEVEKMASKGKIDTKTFLKAVEKNIGGAAKIIGEESFVAAVKNIGSDIGRIGANFLDAGGKGGGFFTKLKPMLVDFRKYLSTAEDKAKDLGVEFGKAFEKMVDKVKMLKLQYDALSPAQQDMIKKIALIAPAVAVGIGPALTAFSKLTIITGGTLEVLGKLSKRIGVASAGTGLAASLGGLGPLAVGGIAVAGLTAVGIAAYKMHKRFKEATEVNLELAESLSDQADDLEKVTDKFDKLNGKSKLTTDEFGRLMDVQKELNQTSNPGLIAELQKEYGELAKKSGLSKDEIIELIEANDAIVKQSPDVEKSFTDKGNAIVESTDAIKEYIDSIRTMAIEELIIEQAKAFENRQELLESNKQLAQEIADIEEHMNSLVAARNIPLDQVDARLAEIQQKQNSGLLTAEEHNELGKERNVLEQVQAGLVAESLETAQETKRTLQGKLDLNDEELAKLNAVNDQLADALLKEVDINYEKGEGLTKLDEAIKKLKDERKELEKHATPAQKKTQEYRDQVKELDNAILKHEDIRDEIKNQTGYQSEQNKKLDGQNRRLDKSNFHIGQSIIKTKDQGKGIDNNNKKTDIGIGKEKERTKEAGKSVDKKVTAKDHGTIAAIDNGATASKDKKVNLFQNGLANLNAQASSPRSKKVNLQQQGLATINREASKPVSKIINFIGRGLDRLKFWEKGTDNHPGGPAVVGEKGHELINLPGGRSFVSPNTHTLLNLPRGTEVIPNRETRQILRSFPKYADGTRNWRTSELMRMLAINNQSDESAVMVRNQGDNGQTNEILKATMEQNEHMKEMIRILTALLGKDLDLYKLTGKVDSGLNNISDRRRAAFGG